MSNACGKWKCPNRFSVGNRDDDDVINIICPRCEKMYHYSESKTIKYKKYSKIVLVVLSLLIVSKIAWLNRDSIKSSLSNDATPNKFQSIENSPEETITNFFNYLNEGEYYEAFKLTDHARWNTLNSFSKNVQHWKNIRVMGMEGKEYFSRYGADTIVHVIYKGAEDNTGKIELRDYDYHLKLENGKYKIVRIYFPMDPESDALKKNEIPSSATNAVKLFLRFLDERKYKKAHRLTDNPKWGNQANFLSTNNFGCISHVTIYKVQKARNLSTGNEVVFANYYLEDSCNGSKEYNLYFLVSKNLDYWRIIDVSNRINEFN